MINRCWCHIPIIGGGGTNHKDHVAQWERQFCEVLAALEYIIKRYVDDLYTNQVKGTGNICDSVVLALSWPSQLDRFSAIITF